jgi:hypothetical protein
MRFPCTLLNSQVGEVCGLPRLKPTNGFPRSPADSAVSMRVKDALREQCITDIAAACFTILESYHASHPALGKACLGVLAKYIPWIDIGLVAPPRRNHIT